MMFQLFSSEILYSLAPKLIFFKIKINDNLRFYKEFSPFSIIMNKSSNSFKINSFDNFP